jgi:predicted metal-binding membrane protein
MAGVAEAASRRTAFGALHAGLLGTATVAWVVTIVWARSTDGGAMPGTMGFTLAGFVVMWAVMMAAMMLPSVWPFAGTYARTVTGDPVPRLLSLAAGYLAAWAGTGIGAYVLARLFGELAQHHTTAAHVTAVVAFAGVGLYQLTPLKRRCLSHCRSPLVHLFHYTSFRGRTRDARAGLYHGFFCLGCCWALMVLLVAFGVMNIPAMVGLALTIAVEKVWRYGQTFARVVGLAALLYAAALIAVPGLAPGLDPSTTSTMMSDMNHGTSGPQSNDMPGGGDGTSTPSGPMTSELAPRPSTAATKAPSTAASTTMTMTRS